ncbi:MAG TPA: ABC transporter permease [bacterium]|nr:ABC transporter permease [bacterium]
MAAARGTGIEIAAAAGQPGGLGARRLRSSRGTLARRLRRSWQVKIGGTIVVLMIVVAAAAPLLAPLDPTIPDILHRFQGPSRAHFFGTDSLGRDIFSQVVHGSRISLTIGLISVGISAAAGITLGVLAGFYRRLDDPIMRVMDVLLAFPNLLLAIAIIAALGPSLQNAMIAVGIGGIPGFVRIVRSAVFRVRGNEYVDAARAVGVRDVRMLARHVLPNISSEVIVTATLGIAAAILAAAGLSFLGLGAQPPTPEWGAMANLAKDYLNIAPYWSFFPIAAIFVTILGFNFLGDGLRDALDPRLHR